MDGLRILSERMPWIEALSLRWTPQLGDYATEASALTRLTALKALSLSMKGALLASRDERRAAVNHLLTAAGSMRQLESLKLSRCYDEGVAFAPLIALAQLRSLVIHAPFDHSSALPSDEQLAALRRMHSLAQFDHNFTDRNSALRLLLQAPVPPLRGSRLALLQAPTTSARCCSLCQS